MEEMQEAVTAVLGEITFDPNELHAKYLSERDKRVRDDHNEQYVETSEKYFRPNEVDYLLGDPSKIKKTLMQLKPQ